MTGYSKQSDIGQYFSCEIATSNHRLLGDKHLRCRNFNSKIALSHHNTVRFLEDLIKIIYTLLVFDFRNYLDFLPLLSKDLANSFDIGSPANERRKYHMHTILYPK